MWYQVIKVIPVAVIMATIGECSSSHVVLCSDSLCLLVPEPHWLAPQSNASVRHQFHSHTTSAMASFDVDRGAYLWLAGLLTNDLCRSRAL